MKYIMGLVLCWGIPLLGTEPFAVSMEASMPAGDTETRGVSGREMPQATLVAIEDGYRAMREDAFEEAAGRFQSALAVDPDNRRARLGLGLVYIKTHDFREALDILEPMMEEFPEDYSIRNNVAWMYATARDHDLRDGKKALRLAREALLKAPRDYHVWSTLSESYYVLNRYDRALRAAEQAVLLARRAEVEPDVLRNYLLQADKCRRAMQTDGWQE